ncbi:hypothetical protein [Pseudomonas sp. CGJS7]|uniref:hypothetical protein n=1 Tax=Pseudomonas sp. CGJS7 TaxID=3109348 RepID=UPI003009C240
MGCDIDLYAECRDSEGKFRVMPAPSTLQQRNYWRYSFLAGARNSFNIVPISEPRGLPDDVSGKIADESERQEGDALMHSWLTLEELIAFDYDAPLRFKQGGRGENCTEATYREFLDEHFVEDMRELQTLGAERIVFWFVG